MRLGRSGDPAQAPLDAFLLAGDAAAATWVLGLLQDGLPARPFGQALLSGRASAPMAVAPRAPQVCNCFDVSQAKIVATLASCTGGADARLAQVQDKLRCGTQCGSCLPAVRALVARLPPTPVRAEPVEASLPFDGLSANGVTA